MAGMVSMGIVGDPNRKYNLQQQQIDLARDKFNQEAQTMALQRQLMPDQVAAENYARRGAGFAAFGQGSLSNANAKLAPDLVGSEIGLRAAQARSAGAAANASNVQASLAPGVSASENALRAAQVGNFDVMGMLQRLQAAGLSQGQAAVSPDARYYQGLRWYPNGNNPAQTDVVPGHAAGTSHVDPNSMPMHPMHRAALAAQFGFQHAHQMQGMAAGDSMVDPTMDGMGEMGMAAGGGHVGGPGDGTVDTVDTKLAAGEAVLNKAAADFLGRDLIDKVNQAGAIAMGLDQKPNEPRMQPAGQPGTPATEPAQPGQQMGMAAGSKKVPAQKAAAAGKEAPRKGPPGQGQRAGAKNAPAKPAAKGKGKAMDAKMPDMTQMIAQMMGGMG